jgi:hypothetical protein
MFESLLAVLENWEFLYYPPSSTMIDLYVSL